jgi:hypothetical protein
LNDHGGFVRRPLGAKSLAALVAGALTVGVASCGAGRESGTEVEAVRPAGFEATPEYLASATADLDALPHRFEMTMRMGIEIDGDFRGPDASTLTGAFDGERQDMRMDMGGLAASTDGEPTEQILDLPGSAIYVRAPSAAEMAEGMPDLGATTEYLDVLGELGDRWGRADLGALADVLPEDWTSQVGQIRLQNLDPESFVDLVAGAASVEELGTSEVQGEAMIGLGASVTAADFAEAQGTSATVTEPTVEAEPGSLADVFASLQYKVEAWIDSDGHVRRLVMDQGDAMRELLEDTDIPRPGAFTFILTLDLSDYGDESIQVDIPAASDTVDVTDATRDMFEAQHSS